MTARVTPLGDRAVLAYLPYESAAVSFAAAVRSATFPWVEDIVPAYVSVGVHFDPAKINLGAVRSALSSLTITTENPTDGRLFVIPCCYDLQLDLEKVAAHLQLASAEVVSLHTAYEFRVYAIGFCPGFPYLGYLPVGDRIRFKKIDRDEYESLKGKRLTS
jgi:inhibitor of KinA